MKRFIVLFLLLLIAVLARPVVTEAADVYDDFTVAVDTTPDPNTCDGSDGCLEVNARSIVVQNTGDRKIFMRFDSPSGTITTTGRAGLDVGSPPLSIDVTDRHTTIKRVYFKTAADTSTALVRILK